MKLFETLKQNRTDKIKTQEEMQNQQIEADKQKNISAAKKQMMLNNLLIAKTPTGGQ